MSPLKWIVAGAALGAVAAACSTPDFTYDTTTASAGQGGTSSSSSSSSSSTGTAGAGGSSSSSSSSSSSTSSSSGTPMCRLLHDLEDCGSGKRCTLANEDTGDTHCVALQTPTKKRYEACVDDSHCPAGTWCDWRNAVCAPFCDVAADCDAVGNGDCVGATNGSSEKIPGITICTANCDPGSATSCGPGAACNYDNNYASLDCFYSAGKTLGDACGFADCGPTLVCAGTTGSFYCESWCSPIAASSSDCGGNECKGFVNLTPTYNGQTYGFCL